MAPPPRNTSGPEDVELPVACETTAAYASDTMAEVLRALGIEYVALNPGASYRGLHDSLVNHLGNRAPQMLLCLHEEHAVAIAHGWAKVRETPMAAILHSNVGLMHATMAIFNMWCDRLPVILLGATGPLDAEKRRPWVDWIHTTTDQAALIRDYIKWDNQPASVGAAVEALLRANIIAQTAPRGPVYVNLDAGLQEAALARPVALPDLARHRPPRPTAPPDDLADEAAAWLLAAKRPVILAGKVSRDEGDWRRRIELAEATGAVVLTDVRSSCSFPTDHPNHGPAAGGFPSAATSDLLRQADVVLCLGWVDTAGFLKVTHKGAPVTAKVIQASLDQHAHRGWNMDYQALPPVDLYLLSDPDAATAALLAAVRRAGGRKDAAWAGRVPTPLTPPDGGPESAEGLRMAEVAAAIRTATRGHEVTMVTTPSGWNEDLWPVSHPLDHLGRDGGGGIGTGPGSAIGAALALRGSGRIAASVMGDGNFLMGATAIWTAVHYRIPVLMAVANNISFFNDETHQGIVARDRGRPFENKWIGQRIGDPDIDIAGLAAAQGASGFGPVRSRAELAEAMAAAVAAVLGGGVAVVDCRTVADERPIPSRG